MKTFLITLALISAIVLIFPASVSAATSAGVKPGSFWYGLDIAFEKINLFFTFNPESKARKSLEYADERLAEAEAVAENNNTDAVKTAITNYESNIAFAAEKSKDVSEKEKTEALLILIADNTSKHQEILADVLTKVPNETKESIMKAIEASKRGQEEAIKQIAELKGGVDKLKKEVAELKVKDAEREKVIKELNKPRAEITPAPTKPTTPSIPPKPTTPTPTPTPSSPELISTPTQTPVYTYELEDGLNRLYTQITLNFIKTASDHLVNIAVLLSSKFNILVNGRNYCSQTYDNLITEKRESGEQRISSEIAARQGFSTNSALIQQMRDDLENDILSLQKDKEACLLAYPLPDSTLGDKITQEVSKLDGLYRRVSTGTNSITEAANMLQEYNSIEARIYSFKDYIPSPLQPVSMSSVPKPVPPVGSFKCTFSPTGNGYSCSDSFSNMRTSCQFSPTGNSWGCNNSDGSNTRCQMSPTGNSVSCSSY